MARGRRRRGRGQPDDRRDRDREVAGRPAEPVVGRGDADPRRARADGRRRHADHRGGHRPGRRARRRRRTARASRRDRRAGGAIEHGHRGRPQPARGRRARRFRRDRGCPCGSRRRRARAVRAPPGRRRRRRPLLVRSCRRRPRTGRRGSRRTRRGAGRTAPAERTSVLVGYGVAEADRSSRARGSPPGHRPHALAKPPVRKLARELGVDLDSVSPTGPGGIVTREDVLGRAAQAEAPHPGHLPRRRRAAGWPAARSPRTVARPASR